MTSPSCSVLKAGAFGAFPLIPVLVLVAYYAGPAWLVPAFVFIAIPVLDYLIGSDPTPPMSAPVRRAASVWLRAVPRIYVALWLAILGWAAYVFAHEAH